MGRQYSISRKNDPDTAQFTDDSYFHDSGNISHPRRNTEPDASYRHWQNETPDPEFNSLYRASTIDNWDDRHRQRAAREPMVEYMCDEPFDEQDENEIPIVIPCRKANCQHEPEDEEAPLIIPATYQYDPSLHQSSLAKTSPPPDRPHHHYPSESSHSYLNSDPSEAQSPSPTSHLGFGKSDLIDKISAYVLSRSGTTQNGPLTPESKRLVDSLANEILIALRTGHWDQVPAELVRDVKEVLT